MPVDYSKVPTADLEALAANDLSKVSTTTLEMLAGGNAAPKKMPEPDWFEGQGPLKGTWENVKKNVGAVFHPVKTAEGMIAAAAAPLAATEPYIAPYAEKINKTIEPYTKPVSSWLEKNLTWMFPKAEPAYGPEEAQRAQNLQNIWNTEKDFVVRNVTDPLGIPRRATNYAWNNPLDAALMIIPGLGPMKTAAESAGLAKTANAIGRVEDFSTLPLGLAKKGIQAAESKISNISAIRNITTTEAADQALSQVVQEGLNKGLRPSVTGKGTNAGREAYYDRGETAVKDIIANKGNLQYSGGSKGALPATLQDVSDAINQRMGEVFGRYDAMASQAGNKGAMVTPQTAVKEIQKIAGGKHLPEVTQYAAQRAEWLKSLGEMSPGQAQNIIAELNAGLKAYYANPTFETASRAGIDSIIVNQLRKAQDAAITSATGAGYQELRNLYGSLKTLEGDINHRILVEMRKNPRGLIDFSNMMTSGEFVHGVLSMNPATMGAALVSKAVTNYYKYLNSPDTAIKNMFSNAAKIIDKRATIEATGEATMGMMRPETAKALPPFVAPTTEAWPVTTPKLNIQQRQIIPAQASPGRAAPRFPLYDSLIEIADARRKGLIK